MINDQMLFLDPWQQSSYSPEIRQDMVNTSQSYGSRAQALGAGRQTYVFNAVRRFNSDDEIMFFTALTRVTLKGCTLKFIDRYVNETGVVQGVMRIVGGSGEFSSSGKDHAYNCTIEVLDGLA